ncbi:MAG: DUF5685 family protein [Eubacteriales bacterium]|nr:DUF5685 family protein [Eubacteriales bacterium]
MFGYVVVNKEELKFREFNEYKAIYCGLCRTLREKYGIAGQLTLNYDLTFVVLLLSGLYEPPHDTRALRCMIHPFQKQKMERNEFTEYAADLNILFSYYKCLDDWRDDRDAAKLFYSCLLKKGNRKAALVWKKKARTIVSLLRELNQKEKEEEKNPDVMAGLFGKIMAEILACREDVWESHLRKMGFYLGKFIYLMDAYEDVYDDRKKGCYNLFSDSCEQPGFDEEIREILTMMMAECCREFEMLPVLKYGEILRNILYSGVWSRYLRVKKERRQVKETK